MTETERMDVAAMAPGTGTGPAGAPPGWLDERLAEFQRHLAAGRGMSPHTVRAYAGDARSLLEHACLNGLGELAALDIGAIRSWLAAQHAGGRARATLARRAAAARAFTAFSYSRGWLAADPGSSSSAGACPRAGERRARRGGQRVRRGSVRRRSVSVSTGRLSGGVRSVRTGSG
jgi:hypothetical protein